ncbi:Outer membrane protein OmpA [Mariprofundus ferrinatatus]|uniref:Outer membrane protein OmpA n=1 Tax=Mariprofundus ferrinatatus TaxID=1921087 RepID=A0A2K8L1Y9_9PROT|nr:OmpA family protein [Mariprofundus ferrinatatus]ATX81328.1 Outer membrane protein OmpA [Mariprofundus ferrinatatus]
MQLRPYLTVLLSLSFLAFSSPVQAAPMDDAKSAIGEAEALRAAEFAPEHYNAATGKLAEAESLLNARKDTSEVVRLLHEATLDALQAAELSQQFTSNFPELVESRDRLSLAGDEYVRGDLGERSEKEFAGVVASAEEGNISTAHRKEKIALGTFHAAQVVAAREQFVRPISKAVAEARRNKARDYSPKAMNEAIQTQSMVEKLIKENPNAQSEAYSLSQKGQYLGNHAIRVSGLGMKFSSNPSSVESWVDASDARMTTLANTLGLKLDRSQSPDVQLALLKQAIEEMQAEHKAQIADADKQVRELGDKLAKYEGELSDMAEVRRKLQLKREAEAKIKQLTKLFDPEAVEILLTPDADVILRMKKLNFLSGSAVIPPAGYPLLDNAIKSIELFAGRKVRVEGHTDFIGNNDYNQKLSERRAKAVEEYLKLQMSAEGDVITAIGHGEEKPIANNETAAGRTKNRRIDIVLIAPPAVPGND